MRRPLRAPPRRSILLPCLSALALASCATPAGPDGQGGAGGDASASSTAQTSSAKSSSASSTGAASSASSASSGAGGCIYAEDCTAMSDACNVGACINGACGKLPANELGGCDDGLFCTQNDFCKKGQCVGGTAPPCPASDACHVGVCDEATDSCSEMPGNDGGPCEDQDPCTATGVCMGGACDASAPVDCSIFDDQCSVGVCDPATGCKPQPVSEGKPCNDGKFCTDNDACKAGVCTGTPRVCPAPLDSCATSVCDNAKQACVSIAGPNGASCDDKNACTTGEICSLGACAGGVPANDGGPCDDGKACTAGDSCAGGACQGSAIVTCQGGDGCCPPGCSIADDADCTCGANLARTASPSISSGGATPPFSPASMNDGLGKTACQYAFLLNSAQPTGAFLQLAWPAPVTIGSLYIETDSAQTSASPCFNPPGRNVRSGTVEFWDGASWVTATSFANQTGDVKLDLPAPVTTTMLRVFNVTTSAGSSNSVIYEWHVYPSAGCSPPP